MYYVAVYVLSMKGSRQMWHKNAIVNTLHPGVLIPTRDAAPFKNLWGRAVVMWWA